MLPHPLLSMPSNGSWPPEVQAVLYLLRGEKTGRRLADGPKITGWKGAEPGPRGKGFPMPTPSSSPRSQRHCLLLGKQIHKMVFPDERGLAHEQWKEAQGRGRGLKNRLRSTAQAELTAPRCARGRWQADEESGALESGASVQTSTLSLLWSAGQVAPHLSASDARQPRKRVPGILSHGGGN